MRQVGVMVCARESKQGEETIMSNEARGLVKANFIERVIVSGSRIEILYRKGTSLLERVGGCHQPPICKERGRVNRLNHLGCWSPSRNL